VVHSYKDLGSERPEGIELAAITERKFPNDILLISKQTQERLNEIDTLIVGTSSPRRIVNIESSLKEWIPGLDGEVKCETLRGNVNTRIQKLRDGQYHAIVLAHAGLERLALKSDSKAELEKLLEGLDYLLLPASEFPPAASQGALAIEFCPENQPDNHLEKALKSVHCEITASSIKKERKAFQEYGGGCHLAVGVHVFSRKGHFVHIHKGEVDHQAIQLLEQEGFSSSEIPSKRIAVLGKNNPAFKSNHIETDLDKQSSYFCTSQYCIDAIVKTPTQKSLYAAGSMSAKKLVKQGFWVNASADSLGHEEIKTITSSRALNIMDKTDKVVVLSHTKATSPLGNVIGCYEKEFVDVDKSELANLQDAEALYWNSFSHYQHYTSLIPALKDKKHYCGLGKTLDAFSENNIDVTPVYKMSLFKGKSNE
jgi:hydroxymethylbilane synthase